MLSELVVHNALTETLTTGLSHRRLAVLSPGGILLFGGVASESTQMTRPKHLLFSPLMLLKASVLLAHAFMLHPVVCVFFNPE
jgi:hypothetical protein